MPKRSALSAGDPPQAAQDVAAPPSSDKNLRRFTRWKCTCCCPQLGAAAYRVSQHQVRASLHRKIAARLTAASAQNPNPPFRPSCQLPPAADMPLNWLSFESCQYVWPGRALQDGSLRATNVRAATMYQVS